MTKISWTCQQCGMWHSQPDDHSPAPLRATCCRMDQSGMILEAFLGDMQAGGWNPEALVVIESSPATYFPLWMHPAAKESGRDLRAIIVSYARNQEFRCFCQACGFDSTDLLVAGKTELPMVSITMALRGK